MNREERGPAVTATAEEQIAQRGTTHYGLTVLELGEDGGTLVVLGHHSDRRTLAALNAYARKVWGQPLEDGRTVLAELTRVNGVVVHACHRGWDATFRVDNPATLTDPSDNKCQDCRRTGAEWALLYRPDVQTHPEAFPVTTWEYDA